jgi:hypothetical protein
MSRKRTPLPPGIDFALAVQRVLSAADALKLSIDRVAQSPPRQGATARPSEADRRQGVDYAE